MESDKVIITTGYMTGFMGFVKNIINDGYEVALSNGAVITFNSSEIQFL